MFHLQLDFFNTDSSNQLHLKSIFYYFFHRKSIGTVGTNFLQLLRNNMNPLNCFMLTKHINK